MNKPAGAVAICTLIITRPITYPALCPRFLLRGTFPTPLKNRAAAPNALAAAIAHDSITSPLMTIIVFNYTRNYISRAVARGGPNADRRAISSAGFCDVT